MAEARRTRANGRASRDELLVAAAESFARDGYRGTTLKQIASRAGMTLQGLLHHFPTKHELLLEVVRARSLAVEPDRNANPGMAFHARLERHIRDLSEASVAAPVQQLLLTTLVAESLDPTHPLHETFVERYRRVRDGLSEMLRAAQEAGECRLDVDPESFARESVAMMDGLQLQWLLDPDTMDLAGALTSWSQRLAQELAPVER